MVRSGVGATSLDLIAEHAGYTKGAVYSNFSSKEEILQELMQIHMRDELAALADVLGSSTSLDDLIGRLTALYSAMLKDPGVIVLSLEFQLLATRRNEVRESYGAIWLAHREKLAELLGGVAKRLHFKLLLPAIDLIDGLAAVTHGLVLQSVIGRAPNASPAAQLMIQFLRNHLQQNVRLKS